MIFMYYSGVDKMPLWRAAVLGHFPDAEFRVWPDVGDKSEIDYAIVWRPPEGELKSYPNLKAILSLGAGIDGILCDPDLPRDVPIVRLVDRCLTEGMSEYVLYWTLHFHRKFDRYLEMSAERNWGNLLQDDTHEKRVGILGLGELGGDAGRKLAAIGFDVAAWSRTPKSVDGITSFSGADALAPFLARTEILVCLLPLTAETEGIIDAGLLAGLPEGAVVINCARGGHVVDDDLLAALDSGHIHAAVLDVFHKEPLADDHAFWGHPKVTVTPHMASLTVPSSASEFIAENVRLIEQGKAPLNTVDLDRGY